jgi:uncharacterized protein (DUF885 family)
MCCSQRSSARKSTQNPKLTTHYPWAFSAIFASKPAWIVRPLRLNMKRFLCFFALAALAAAPAFAQGVSADEDAKRMFERCYAEASAFDPIGLSWNGDYSRNSELNDLSEATEQAVLQVQQRCLTYAQRFNPSQLSQGVRESLEVFIYQLQQDIEGFAFRKFAYISNPIGGWDTGVFQLMVSAHPIRNAQDAQAYLSRAKQIARFLTQARERMVQNQQAGVVLPKPLFGAVFANYQPLMQANPAKHPLALDFARKLKDAKLPKAEAAQLQAQLQQIIGAQILPALRANLRTLREQERSAPVQGGLSRIDGGAAAYDYALKANTTTAMTAGQVHELGLRTVADLKAQMQAAFAAAGLNGGFTQSVQQLRTDARFFYPNTDVGRREMLADAMRYTKEARTMLPQLFGRLPKAEVSVRRMEAFSEAGDAAARYQSPALDGSQPGIYYLNLANTKRIPRYTMEALSYHEALPGHHMQNAIAQELGELPTFRRRAWYVAYGEGWALYSEQLGKEVGQYKTPLSEVGRLTESMWRAARLVVDTGLHAKNWTRAQAIDYMLAHIPSTREEVTAEVDRYLVWPGQATGYMVGKLRILTLREKAQQQLGAKFDVRRFHDAVLATGPVPLDVLEAIIARWIAAEQAR